MNTMLAGALLLGVAGSAHCLGMCGPIALAVPSPGNSLRERMTSTVILNSGRLTTYVLIGIAFGALGHGARLAGLQQWVSILAGAILLASVIIPGLLERWNPTGRMSLHIGRLRGALARNLRRTAPEALFLTGALNGLLPCGLLYGAALGAAAMGTWQEGALFMLLFGLGTWPALVGLRMSGGLLSDGTRTRLRKASPVIMAAMGLLLILRGAQLGIPYLSPSAPVTPSAITACH